jgi:hypothetical protein
MYQQFAVVFEPGACVLVSCCCCSGIIARVDTGDEELEAAVEKNDTSTLSKDMLSLLHTTLANWRENFSLDWDKDKGPEASSGSSSSSGASSADLARLQDKVGLFIDRCSGASGGRGWGHAACCFLAQRLCRHCAGTTACVAP